MPRINSSLLLCIALVSASGCRSQPERTSAAAPVEQAKSLGNLSSSAGVADSKVSASKSSAEIHLPDFVVVRRYDDVFRENDKDVPVTVEYGWDYHLGVVVERVYDRGGALHSQRQLPGQTLAVTDPELELAFAIARESPELSVTLSEPNLNFYGGFSYLNSADAPCSRGSRCVHLIVSGGNDGERPVAHSIVDLMTRRVIHPFFTPETPDPSKHH